MADKEEPKAEPTPIPAEAPAPSGPTVEELQARITTFEAKYKQEVGDRDRGNARLSNELKELRAQHATALESLARRVYGEEDEPTETELNKWRKNLHPKEENPAPPVPRLTNDQLVATGRMLEQAEEYGIDVEKPPPELASVLPQVIALYHSETPLEGAKLWRATLKKMADDKKATTEAEHKAKQEEARRKAVIGQKDTASSTGGGAGSYEAIRDAYIKDPTNPAAFQAYKEAREARGI